MTPNGIAMLEQQEGFRSAPYSDTRGNLTIGFGTNLEEGITREQAEGLLTCALNNNLKALNSLAWFAALDPVRQDVIENMTYNMGLEGVLEFQHMIEAIEAKDWAEAARQMVWSEWATQVRGRAWKLADLMESGAYPL